MESAPTIEERQDAMDKLVPTLPDAEWGSSTQKSVPMPEAGASRVAAADETATATADRKAAFEPEKYDGVSDESEDEDDLDPMAEGLEDGEDGAQVVGETEVDMDNEMADFLKFTREALGLSEAQYNDILKSRSDRGGACHELSPSNRNLMRATRRSVCATTSDSFDRDVSINHVLAF